MLLKFVIYLTLLQCALSWLYRSVIISTNSHRHNCHHTGANVMTLPRRQQPQHRFHAEPPFNRNGKSVASPLGYNDTTTLVDTDIHQYDSSSSTHGAAPQLWLDLRGTALFPNEAIRFIHDHCSRNDIPGTSRQEASTHLVDAVLVSSSHFDRILASYNSMDLVDQDTCGKYKLYYTTNDTTPEQIMLHDPTIQQSIPVGRVMACSEKEKTKLDVVALSELIVQQQQWVLLQEKATTAISTTSSSTVSKYVMTQLTEVMQFLSSSSNRMIMNMEETNFQVTASGLFLPSSDPNMMSDNTPHTGTSSEPNLTPPPEQNVSCDDTNHDMHGGIAMACTDRTSFLMVDALWAEFRQLASIGTTTTTVSGITIPSSSSGANTPTNNIPQRQRQESPFVAAFVLPLDVSIWETVYNNQARYGEDNNNDNVDDDDGNP